MKPYRCCCTQSAPPASSRLLSGVVNEHEEPVAVGDDHGAEGFPEDEEAAEGVGEEVAE